MNRTGISWCDYTVNPVRFLDATGRDVWSCVKVSAGCTNCYASALEHRYHGGEFTVAHMAAVEPYLCEKTLSKILHARPRPPFRNGERPMVFLGDMTDVFGDWVPDEFIDRVFAVMALTPQHTYQILTKRPERMRAYLTHLLRENNVIDAAQETDAPQACRDATGAVAITFNWPLPNVWLGVSAEDQATADARIPVLLGTPAAVRFVSYEPALGPVDFTSARYFRDSKREPEGGVYGGMLPSLDWIIVGGESGPGARPFDVQWARDTIAQCRDAGVACFIKQVGAKPCMGEVETCAGTGIFAPDLVNLRHSHGGDPSEWPEDLRVREFPGGDA